MRAVFEDFLQHSALIQRWWWWAAIWRDCLSLSLTAITIRLRQAFFIIIVVFLFAVAGAVAAIASLLTTLLRSLAFRSIYTFMHLAACCGSSFLFPKLMLAVKLKKDSRNNTIAQKPANRMIKRTAANMMPPPTDSQQLRPGQSGADFQCWPSINVSRLFTLVLIVA